MMAWAALLTTFLQPIAVCKCYCIEIIESCIFLVYSSTDHHLYFSSKNLSSKLLELHVVKGTFSHIFDVISELIASVFFSAHFIRIITQQLTTNLTTYQQPRSV